jgi:hypothetical protein
MNSSYLNLITQQHYLSVFSGNYIMYVFCVQKTNIYFIDKWQQYEKRTKYFQSDVVFIIILIDTINAINRKPITH